MEQNREPAREMIESEWIMSIARNEYIQRRPEVYVGRIGEGTASEDGIYSLLEGAIVRAVDEFQIGFGKGFAVEVIEGYAAFREGECFWERYSRGVLLEKGMGKTPRTGAAVPEPL